MDLPITARPERRAAPRSAQYLQTPPLLQAPVDKPALLADLQAAITLAEVDPRAVTIQFHGKFYDLRYAKYLVQSLEEELQGSGAGQGNCYGMPAKQVPTCPCGHGCGYCGNESCQ